MSLNKPAILHRPDDNLQAIFEASFFAILFFLCSADQFFATRVHGFNFRWGQGLLLAAACFSLLRRGAAWKTSPSLWSFEKKIILYWIPFFLVYAFTAMLSPNPQTTLLKWGWGLFNIGCASVVCLGFQGKNSLEKGFRLGILAIAGSIWAESFTMNWLDITPDRPEWFVSFPLWVHPFGFPLLLGYAQSSYHFADRMMWRPNAFYYESSYAGCALAFALPLTLAMKRTAFTLRSTLFSSFILASVVLISSRSGILSLSTGFLFLTVLAFWKGEREFIKMLLKTFLLGLLWLGLFCLAPLGRNQMAYTFGLFQEHLSAEKLGNPGTSEGGRMAALREGLHAWGEHPLLGNGVQAPPPDSGRKLGVSSDNTWLEVAIESGLVGLLCFILALWGTMKESLRRGPQGVLPVLVMGAWFSHFLVNLNLTQTFPRLDYWLLFFFSIRLLISDKTPMEKGKKI